MKTIDFTELVKYKPEIKANLLILQIFRSVSIKEISALRLPEQAETFIESEDPVLQTAALYCVAQIRSFQGNLDESVDYYQRAYHAALKAKQYFMALISVKNLSITLLLFGRKKEAVELCNAAMKQLVDARGKLLPAAVLLYVPLGMAYYSEDNLQMAKDCLQKGVNACKQLELIHFAVQGEMSLALVLFALNDIDGALRTIHNSCESLKDIGMEIGVPMFMAIEAEMNLRRGHIQFTRKWANETGLSGSTNTGILDERQYFTYGRLLIADGQYGEAEKLLESLGSLAAEGGRVYRLITVHILKAIVYIKMNQTYKALENLEKAIEAAAPEEFYRLFLDEDPCIVELLNQARVLAPEFIDKLIEKYNLLDHHSLRIEPLSVRELEVLKLIAGGFSNQEIAEKLFITIGTTKWHITNIFSKLGVKNRVQAVEAAKNSFQK